ncbi:MAG: isochorismatase family protein [Nakamurella sp.]
MTLPAAPSALIVIDVQDGFSDTRFWGPSANPQAESHIESLVSSWGAQVRGPVVLVRHDSVHPDSPLFAGSAGNRLQSFLDTGAAELLVTKSVNSAFYGHPDLHAWLQEREIAEVVLCGIQTNMCVETTARMAGNLGYLVTVALDATRTFDLTTTLPGGEHITRSASELMLTTALNLAAGGFATIATTAELVRPRQVGTG